jgi:broad specificity phosphatase PhoE
MVYLVRHGEVDNPDHVVYADLPGFGLGAAGRAQAEAVAAHLSHRPIAAVATSPLTRAVETAAAIGTALELEPEIDDRLTEWRLGRRWAGVRWEDLGRAFPGELDAYLDHPQHLAFSPEPIEEVADRMIGFIADLTGRHADAELVVVSHQDPIQAARLALTGRSLSELQHDKPGHASAVTLIPGSPWREAGVWTPDLPASIFPPIPQDPPGQ